MTETSIMVVRSTQLKRLVKLGISSIGIQYGGQHQLDIQRWTNLSCPNPMGAKVRTLWRFPYKPRDQILRNHAEGKETFLQAKKKETQH